MSEEYEDEEVWQICSVCNNLKKIVRWTDLKRVCDTCQS